MRVITSQVMTINYQTLFRPSLPIARPMSCTKRCPTDVIMVAHLLELTFSLETLTAVVAFFSLFIVEHLLLSPRSQDLFRLKSLNQFFLSFSKISKEVLHNIFSNPSAFKHDISSPINKIETIAHWLLFILFLGCMFAQTLVA